MRLLKIFIIFLLFSLSFSFICINGIKTWDIGYGIGDSNALFSYGYYPGINLDQSLRASIFGTQYATIGNFPIGIKINGIFNDHNQLYYKLNIDIFKDDFHLLLGDYDYKIKQEYLKFGDHLKGIAIKKNGKFGYFLGLSKVEGKYQTKTFRGQSLSEHLEFNSYNQYLLNSKGLESKKMDLDFVQNYTKVYLQFTNMASLTAYLSKYQMGYLISFDSTNCELSIKNDGKYEIHNYIVIPNNILLLTDSSTDILRNAIIYYINRYNEYKNLSQENKKKYLDKNQDSVFLKGLRQYVELSFNYPKKVLSFNFERNGLYFDLMNSNVIPQSITITTNSSETVSFTLIDYQILKLTKPISEFCIDYRYENSNSIFFLGLNVIPNSESVYLNNQLLTKNIDYYIDYNTGMLTIFRQITDNDTIIVNYQTSLTSFTSQQYYNTYILLDSIYYHTNSLSIQFNNVSAFQLFPKIESYLIPTMPNNKYNFDLNIKLKRKGFSANYEGNIIYQDYEDPTKNNEKFCMTQIIKIYDYYVISSNNGIIVFKNGEIYNFTSKDGISSNMVNDMCLSENNVLYLATNNGISYIDLDDSFGKNPQEVFSKNIYGEDNWKYYSTSSGLNSIKINSVSFHNNILYAGSKDGIYELQDKKFIKIQDGPIQQIRFFNNDMFYIKNGDLYKNNILWLNGVVKLKIYKGSFYVFTKEAIYNDSKNVVEYGNFYDFVKNDESTVYSDKTGIYQNSSLVSTGTYYYIIDNIAVGNDILTLSPSPTHYKLNIQTQYYSSKEKQCYLISQNHVTISYLGMTLDAKNDLQNKYIGVYLDSSYKNEKFSLKYLYKYYLNSYHNFYIMYLGNDLLNIQSSLSNVSSSISINSKYINKYLILSNFIKYENHKLSYQLYGDTKKSLGMIKKFNYCINKNGASLLSYISGNNFDSKINLFYYNGIKNLLINPVFKINFNNISSKTSIKIQYPSISNHLYIEPYQYLSLNTLKSRIGFSISLMKDLGNENSVDIYPSSFFINGRKKNTSYNFIWNNTFYVKNSLLQRAQDIKFNINIQNADLNIEYNDNNYYNTKYLKASISQKLQNAQYGNLETNINYYLSLLDNKNFLWSNLRYIKIYNKNNVSFNTSISLNLKYSLSQQAIEYGLYFGSKIKLSF